LWPALPQQIKIRGEHFMLLKKNLEGGGNGREKLKKKMEHFPDLKTRFDKYKLEMKMEM